MKPKSRGGWAAFLPLALVVFVAGVLPFAVAGIDSLLHDRWGSVGWAGLSNYRALFEDRAFVLSLGITVGWALVSATASVCLGFVLACALQDARRGSRLLYAALLVPWGVPSFISVPIWRMLLHGSGGSSLFSALTGLQLNLLTDPVAGFVAALAVDIWLGVPLSAFAIYASFGGLNRQMTEAAQLDGAGSWAIARWIRLPRIGGTFVLMWTLDFIKSFKEFSVPFMMTAGGPPFPGGITERHIVGATTTLEIFLYDAFRQESEYGVASAYAVAVGFLVIVLVWLRARAGRRPLRERTVSPRPGGARSEALWAAALQAARAAAVLSAALVIYATLWLSFSGLSAVYIDRLVPRFLSARPYLEVVRDEGIFRYFLNTFLVSAVTALLVPLFTLPAALALSRGSAARSTRLFGFLQGLGMTGGIHSLIPLFIVFRLLGLLGGYVPLVTLYVYHAIPFALFSLKAFLDTMPPSYAEAARLEGMTTASYLRRIIAPLAAPALASSMMAAFVSAWNGFLIPLVFLTDDRSYTIGVKLHSWVGSVASGNPKWNLFAAASALNMAIIALLFSRFRSPLARAQAGEMAE